MKSNKSNGELTAQIQVGDHKKSGFDLSNNNLGTGQIGRIIPTRALHVMPGDTIHQDSKVAVQFEPLAVPILANMDVKQEHFYVPYNVVWKNWDKFISGGERMDYNGIVPNVSMVSIMKAVASLLPPIYFRVVKNSSNDKFAITGTDSFVNGDFNVELKLAGERFEIMDLLRPQFTLVELVKNRMLSEPSWLNNAFVLVTGSSDVENARINFGIYLENEGLLGDKYINNLADYIVNSILIFGNALLPTSEFMEFAHYIYDYYRSFVGYSSNIDYLNMNRMSFDDLLFILIDYICTSYQHDASAQLNVTLFNDNIINLYFSTKPMSILHLRANYSIWYNNYRDILLEESALEPVIEDEVTTDELISLLVPRQRCWEKDTFTTALDNPGTGNVAVPIMHDQTLAPRVLDLETDDTENLGGIDNDMDIVSVTLGDTTWKLPTAFMRNLSNSSVDSDSISGFSLYALDAAQRAQKWLQKALYFGNRISDFYYLRFGVRFLDSRLRLPELLTSSSELVKIDVLMNNTTTAESIAGDRAGFASAYDNGNSFERFCEEHGVIMSYLTIMPQATYAYGSCRDYSRLDQFDFAFTEFATLGMDAVYSDEITSSPLKISDIVDVFGYQGKYYDYKAKQSEEHGELLDTQDMYTFARKFNMLNVNTRPKLNYEFVHCFPSLDMFVVDSPLADYFRYDIRHSTAAERNLPSQSIYI